MVKADVVIENYSPGVMDRLGLSFDQLRLLNPRLIQVSMPGFGASGPHRHWLAFGPLIEAASGLTDRMGYEGGGPYRSGVAWPDPVTSLHSASAVLAALASRWSDDLPRARHVEVPMIDSMLAFVGEQLLAAQASGEPPGRRGNRHPGRAPQGCYRCSGDDVWLAISIDSDAAWRSLCEQSGLGSELADLSLQARLAQHDDLDQVLSTWAKDRDAESTMQVLQGAGVLAAVVANGRQLAENPQLAFSNFWVELDHTDVGRHRLPGLPIRLSETPATFRRAAPCLGEHNRQSLERWTDLSAAEIDDLEGSDLLVEAPPPGATYRGVTDRGVTDGGVPDSEVTGGEKE